MPQTNMFSFILILNWYLVVYCLFMVFNATFQQYFSYIVAVSFIGGGNWNTRRKPPTCCKTLTNFMTIIKRSKGRITSTETVTTISLTMTFHIVCNDCFHRNCIMLGSLMSVVTLVVFLQIWWRNQFYKINNKNLSNEWTCEWVSDCCLMPTQQFFRYHGENKFIYVNMFNLRRVNNLYWNNTINKSIF
jgi:hypothetical protein